MGASNVSAVLTHWARLNDKPFRALVCMALMSMDGDSPPRFWGGHEKLAEAIGRPIEPEPPSWDHSPRSDAVRRRRKNDLEAVRVVVRELERVGAITVLARHTPARRAEYGLNLIATSRAHPGDVPGLTPETSRAHPGDFPGSPRDLKEEEEEEQIRGTRETQSGTSPEEVYREARAYLGRLPDLGTALIAAAPDGPLRERVVAAYLANRPGKNVAS